MYAQCPSCNVIFAMTEDDLDAHQGVVRCGHCREVFNASWNLVDSIPNQQPAGLQTETLHTTEETIAAPENIQLQTDDIILDDDEAASDDSLDSTLRNRALRRDQADLDQNEINRTDRLHEQLGQEASIIDNAEHIVESDATETSPGSDVDLADEQQDVGAALDKSDLQRVLEPDAVTHIDTEEVEHDLDLTADVEDAEGADMVATPEVDSRGPAPSVMKSPQEMVGDDDIDPSAAESIDQHMRSEQAADAESTSPDMKNALASAQSTETTDRSADLAIDEIDIPVATEGATHDIDYVIPTENEITLAEPEGVSGEEEKAMEELSSLLTDDTVPEEAILIPEQFGADDLGSTLSSDDELALSDLDTSIPVEAVVDETESSVTDTDLVGPGTPTAIDNTVAAQALDSLASEEEVRAHDTSPPAEAKSGAVAEDSDSPDSVDQNVAANQPDRAEQSAGYGSMFPDVEPEEIIIEAPTRLWKLEEETNKDTEEAALDVGVSRWSGMGRIPYPVRLAAWSLGSILLLFGLVWQIKAHYLFELAQTPSLREPLQHICKYLWCDVPPRADIKAIDLVGTSVDPHPVTPGALRVSANLVNRADFEQQFPHLEITLTDKAGNVVGRRTYLPHEYRGGAPNRMLPKVLERADIDLAQPAESAVGYEIQLVAR